MHATTCLGWGSRSDETLLHHCLEGAHLFILRVLPLVHSPRGAVLVGIERAQQLADRSSDQQQQQHASWILRSLSRTRNLVVDAAQPPAFDVPLLAVEVCPASSHLGRHSVRARIAPTTTTVLHLYPRSLPDPTAAHGFLPRLPSREQRQRRAQQLAHHPPPALSRIALVAHVDDSAAPRAPVWRVKLWRQQRRVAQ